MNDSMVETLALSAPTAVLPSGVRARVWVSGRHLFSRADAQAASWLWLLRDSGCVVALRLGGSCGERDDRIAALLAAFDADPAAGCIDDAVVGRVWRLPAAPVVPVPRWAVSWGHPKQIEIRKFAARLDVAVLAALGRQEVPGPFFGSVTNYNRLIALPPRRRRHRIQALDRFPPLLVGLTLEQHQRADLFGDRELPVAPAASAPTEVAAVLDAADLGRDLVGALARFYRVDRALVRSPLFAAPWAGGAARADVLRLWNAIAAHARPRARTPRVIEADIAHLDALPVALQSGEDVGRLAGAFARGWDATWARIEQRYPATDNGLRDSSDFLRAALAQADLPPSVGELDAERLGLAWVARRGLRSLLDASARWHAEPLRELTEPDGQPDSLAPLIGRHADANGQATELVTRQALCAEGEAMHHCVGSYWYECLFEVLRVCHLELADGSRATASYAWNQDELAPCFALAALRGPCNDDVSMAMQRFAESVAERFNDPALSDQRLAAVRDAERNGRAFDGFATKRVRVLDRRSRDELRQVLAYCSRQADWLNQPAALYRGEVAGFGYAEGAGFVDQLVVGESLALVREPANAYDPLAVRIAWRGHSLGYLPRADNAAIAGLLDRGAELEATIVGVRREHKWSPVEVRVARAGSRNDARGVAGAPL